MATGSAAASHAVIAGAGAAVVAAVAIPVVAFTFGGSPDGDRLAPQPSPTVTDSVPAPEFELTERNLLTDEDAIYPNGGGDWQENDTYPDDGPASVSPCQQSTFAGLGADTVFVRNFEFVHDIVGVDLSNLFSEVVARVPGRRRRRGGVRRPSRAGTPTAPSPKAARRFTRR